MRKAIKKGFSLIELLLVLVVVSAIMLLAFISYGIVSEKMNVEEIKQFSNESRYAFMQLGFNSDPIMLSEQTKFSETIENGAYQSYFSDKFRKKIEADGSIDLPYIGKTYVISTNVEASSSGDGHLLHIKIISPLMWTGNYKGCESVISAFKQSADGIYSYDHGMLDNNMSVIKTCEFIKENGGLYGFYYDV